MKFELPKLDYEYNELEPHIDARTMEIHHTKHHAGYTKNFNAALENIDVGNKTAEEIEKWRLLVEKKLMEITLDK